MAIRYCAPVAADPLTFEAMPFAGSPHKTVAAGGVLISLGAVEWRNPRPDVEIRSLDFTSAMASARPVLLGLTAAGN